MEANNTNNIEVVGNPWTLAQSPHPKVAKAKEILLVDRITRPEEVNKAVVNKPTLSRTEIMPEPMLVANID